MVELTERRRRIIDQAIEMIGEDGLSALTMRRLSERLEVTEPALYRHFESKSAILSGILTVLEGETFELLSLDPGVTPAELLSHFERLFALFTKRPALAAVVFMDEFAAVDPELKAQVGRLLVKNRDRLADVFASMLPRGASNGSIDPDALATLLLGGVRLLVHEWRLDGYRWDLEDRGRRLVAALTDMFTGSKRSKK